MSIIASSIDSKNIIKESQKNMNNLSEIRLSTEITKGNSDQGMLFTLNEMKGNFYEDNREFYNYVSQYVFLPLDVIYSTIVQEARVIQKNEIFYNAVSAFYNDNFFPCLKNYYEHSPSFFSTLFPFQDSNNKYNVSNVHQSFQKYYYLICMIVFTNKNIDDPDVVKGLPEEFIKQMKDWCITRYDQNMMFQITGPKSNQEIIFDFKEHYKTIISPQNTAESVNDYNMLVKLQNISDRTLDLLTALINRPNVYNKNPDLARSYIYNLDSISLQQKYKDTNGNLIFDLAYTDFGDTTEDTTKARLEEIDRLKTENITLSKLNIKKLEDIFNMYSRVKISSLVVDKNTYITNLSQLKTVYVVFSGITCSDRTVGANKLVANGDLAIPGSFVINEQGNYSFVPKSEYTCYQPARTRVKKCDVYLTTYGNSIANNILSSYAINLELTRDKFYNIPLKVVANPSDLFKHNDYNRFDEYNQFPDLLFNVAGKAVKKRIVEMNNNIYTNITNEFLHEKEIIDNEYKMLDKKIIQPVVGPIMFTTWEYINDNVVNGNLVYLFDYDTKLINVHQIGNWPKTSEQLNALMYYLFMKEQPFTNKNYITDIFGNQSLFIDSIEAYKNKNSIVYSPEYNYFNTLVSGDNIKISTERMLALNNYKSDIKTTQNLQFLNDCILYRHKKSIYLKDSMNLGMFTHANIVYNDKTFSYNRVLDHIDISVPLTDMLFRINADTSAYLTDEYGTYKENSDSFLFEYEFSSTDGEKFNKCILKINTAIQTDITATFDFEINLQYLNAHRELIVLQNEEPATVDPNVIYTAFQKKDKNTKIVINIRYNKFDKELKYDQIKEYVVIEDCYLSYMNEDVESIFEFPRININKETLCLTYDQTNNELRLFNKNINDIQNCQTVARWQLQTHILNYNDSTFDKNDDYCHRDYSGWFNPMKTNSFATYNFNDEIIANNVSLINVTEASNDADIFNYIPNSSTSDSITIPIENCYISTDTNNFSNRQYIEEDEIYFDNKKGKLNIGNNSSNSIILYDSDKLSYKNVFNITRKFKLLVQKDNDDDLYYWADTTYDLYNVINNVSTTYSDNKLINKFHKITKIIDIPVLDRLRIILSVDGVQLDPLAGYSFIYYLYTYVRALYNYYNTDSNRNVFLTTGSYSRIFKLDFPLIVNFDVDAMVYAKCFEEYMTGNTINDTGMVKLLYKNFDVYIEVYLTQSETNINVIYVYNKCNESDSEVGKIKYYVNEENIYDYNRCNIMMSSSFQIYGLLEEFLKQQPKITTEDSNNKITYYANTVYNLSNVFNDRYYNVFNYINYSSILNIENILIDIVLDSGVNNVISLYLPVSINSVISAKAKKFTVTKTETNDYILNETKMITMQPSNKYTYINYYNNKYYPIESVFGSDEYYKRLIYYYQVFFDNNYNNIPIFNAAETLSKHDYMTMDYSNNYLNTEKRYSQQYIIDVNRNNFYTIVNNNQSPDPSNYNIANNVVSMLLNKSDIELTLTWD